MVGQSDFTEAHLAIANSLQPNDKITLKWNHDYVTIGGGSSPQRPVTDLIKL